MSLFSGLKMKSHLGALIFLLLNGPSFSNIQCTIVFRERLSPLSISLMTPICHQGCARTGAPASWKAASLSSRGKRIFDVQETRCSTEDELREKKGRLRDLSRSTCASPHAGRVT